MTQNGENEQHRGPINAWVRFPPNPGSLRETGITIGLATYTTLADDSLLSVRRPIAGIDASDLAMAVKGFALDTAFPFSQRTIRDKFYLLVGSYLISVHNQEQVKQMFGIQDATITSVYDFLTDDKTAREQMELLNRMVPTAAALLTHGKSIQQLGMYQWIVDKITPDDNNMQTWPMFATQVPQELLTETERSKGTHARRVAVGQRMKMMGYTLVEAKIVPDERIRRRSLRQSTINRIVTERITQIKGQGRLVRMDDIVDEGKLDISSRQVTTVARRTRRQHGGELRKGLRPPTIKRIAAINSALDALGSPTDQNLRAAVTYAQIIAELAKRTPPIKVTEKMLQYVYVHFPERLNIGERNQSQFTPEVLERIYALADGGTSVSAIARRLNLPLTSVWRKLKERPES